MADTETARPDRWLVIVAAGLAVFMAQADVTVVNVALPTIEREFATSTSITQWVVIGYVLPMVALSLPAGRWLDQMGQRQAFIGSLAGFAVASVAAGLASSMWLLITARVVQGAFGAALFALLPVLATTAVRPQMRGRAMSIVMTLGPLGAVSGPALGGVLIDNVGWPWIFYVNVPVSLLAIAIAFAQLRPGVAPRLPGWSWMVETAVLSGAAVAVMLALTLTADHGSAWLIIAALGLPFLLIWRRLPGSAAPRQLLRSPGMAGPHLALFAEMTAVMTVLFLVPFYLHRAGVSSTDIGLTVVAFPVGVMVFGVMGGMLADRWSAPPIAAAGAIGVTVGIALLVPLGDGWGPAELAWRLAVVGAGAGLFAGQNQTMAMARAPRERLATMGATTSTARQLGLAMGPALATVTWSVAGDGVGGMRLVLGLAAGLGALSALALLGRASLGRSDSAGTGESAHQEGPVGATDEHAPANPGR